VVILDEAEVSPEAALEVAAPPRAAEAIAVVVGDFEAASAAGAAETFEVDHQEGEMADFVAVAVAAAHHHRRLRLSAQQVNHQRNKHGWES
jgi:hypothetical protein